MTRTTAADDPSTDARSPFAAVAPAGTLLDALDAVAAVVEECVLEVEPDGLSVRARDPADVAVVRLELPASAFESYDADAERLGVDLDRLRSVLGVADADEPVRLVLDPGTRTLHLRVGELGYALGLIDPDAIRSPPEELDLADQLAARVVLEGGDLARCVDAADMVADHLALGVEESQPGADGNGSGGGESGSGGGRSRSEDEADPPVFYARAEGDTDAVDVEFPAGERVELDPGDAHSLFSVRYLDSIAGVVPADAAAELRLGAEAPLELSVALGEGSVEYVLAPRRKVR